MTTNYPAALTGRRVSFTLPHIMFNSVEELSAKARRFAEEYLIDFKAGPAALRAGYESASAGYNLMHDPRVDALIREGKRKASERVNISVDSTLESFRIMRDVTAADFFEMKEIMQELPGMPGAPPVQVGTGRFYMALKSLDDWTPEMRHALKSIKHGTNGPEIVLHDKVAVNVNIGKYLDMFVERTDLTSGGKSLGSDLIESTMTAKEAAEAYQATLKGTA